MATQGEKIVALETNQTNIMKEVGDIKSMLSAHILQEDENYKDFIKAIKDWQDVADTKYSTKQEIDDKLKLPNLLVKAVLWLIGLVGAALVVTGLTHIFPNIKF